MSDRWAMSRIRVKGTDWRNSPLMEGKRPCILLAAITARAVFEVDEDPAGLYICGRVSEGQRGHVESVRYVSRVAHLACIANHPFERTEDLKGQTRVVVGSIVRSTLCTLDGTCADPRQVHVAGSKVLGRRSHHL
jgi:hypothetical protein